MLYEAKLILILTTAPDIETAEKIATALVEAKIAACVNIIPRVTSIYRWKEQVQHDSEALLVVKTTQNAYRQIESMIKEMHPYELPEVISLSVADGWGHYIDWVIGEVNI